MILRRQHRHHRPAIREGHDRQFLTVQKLFDQHALTGLAEHRMLQRVADSLLGLLTGRRDHHALPLRQPIGLHHHGKFMLIEIGQGRSELGRNFAPLP